MYVYICTNTYIHLYTYLHTFATFSALFILAERAKEDNEDNDGDKHDLNGSDIQIIIKIMLVISMIWIVLQTV
jgi:hypothetical protein